MPGERLTIGQMSRLSGLTVKALRHYDRVAMIRPATVDAGTGFRYYSPAQVGRARLIRRLRSVDLPLRDIRRCLDDPASMRQILAAHRARLESRATRIAGDLHELNHLLNDEWELQMNATAPAASDIPAGQAGQVSPAGQPNQAAPAAGPGTVRAAEILTGDSERRLAGSLFNAVWELLGTEDRSAEDDDRMLHMAHASRYHWGQVGSAVNAARGEWQCSRVYAVLRRPEPCLHHAQRVLDICTHAGIGDFDLAFAYEALARGHAIAGDPQRARAMTERALAAAEHITDEEDRKILLADLETIPGQARFW